MKNIAVIGSTGSIGTQTLDIVRANDDIKICALSAGKNIDLLEKQIKEFNPQLACVSEEKDALILKHRLAGCPVEIVYGINGLNDIAECPEADMVVTAIVGMIGIRPTIAAINAGKDIALANKETLVTAGHIIMPLAKEKGVSILPVDSEHSAIFQALRGNSHGDVKKLLITASGGPFLGKSHTELEGVSVEDALKHPNWSMGKKITIDSATMVNKGLEVIEAVRLFDIKPSDIQVVVQPQSIIHSMVEYQDGAVIAQLGVPDMKLPIQYALYYPERRWLSGERLDFYKLHRIDFLEPDLETFQGLKAGYEAIEAGGSMPTVFNAANEYAVAQFLDKKIGFTDIYGIIRLCMEAHNLTCEPSLEDIFETEKWVKDYIESNWKGRC